MEHLNTKEGGKSEAGEKERGEKWTTNSGDGRNDMSIIYYSIQSPSTIIEKQKDSVTGSLQCHTPVIDKSVQRLNPIIEAKNNQRNCGIRVTVAFPVYQTRLFHVRGRSRSTRLLIRPSIQMHQRHLLPSQIHLSALSIHLRSCRR
jgi:hypothetical protein